MPKETALDFYNSDLIPIDSSRSYPNTISRDDPLEMILFDETLFLSNVIKQIEGEVFERRKLGEDIEEELLSKIGAYRKSLASISHFAPGYKLGVDRTRIHYEQQIDALEKELRNERLNRLMEMTKFRRELVDFVREYQSLTRTHRLLSDGKPGYDIYVPSE